MGLLVLHDAMGGGGGQVTFSLLRPDVRTHDIGALRRARRRAEKC